MVVRRKILIKTKKLDTKKPQIKHCLFPKYIRIYRPDFSVNRNTKKSQI